MKEFVKPPVPVKVVDTLNLARLALALTEGSQLLWHFPYKDEHILSFFTAYMYWNGDLPILAYASIDRAPKAFLAYRSDGAKGEEWMFSDDADDSRYHYASLISVKNIPKAFSDSLAGDYPEPPEPLTVEVSDLHSLIRVLLPLAVREGTVFPIWHFKRGKTHILGLCIPFEHYYEADAMPVFFYTNMDKPPAHPFLRYSVSRPHGEKVEFANSTMDAKFFYAKIISVEDIPFFP